MDVPASERPRLPASLGDRYVLEQRLDLGGSAEVWRGTDTTLNRPVAIKVVHRHLLADPTSRARLSQEARAAASLSHPGIVAVYDVAVDDEAAAIILELVEGGSLAERIRRDQVLPPRVAARIGAEVAEALDHAHQRGVVHRDVKAANVLLGPDGEARLADFGIARLLDDEATRLTATGTITGTLRYLAPEQLSGGEVGPAADVYAVGVLLAEMLTGEPPYPASTPLELAQAQRTPPLAIGGAPPPLSAIVRQALDPDPTRRPASAAALAAALRAWLETDAAPAPVGGGGEEDTQPALAVPVPIPPPSAAASPPPSYSALPKGRSRSATWVAVGVLAVTILLAAALFLFDALEPVDPGATATATPSASASASPSSTPTTSPTPLPTPPGLDALVAQFRQLVTGGVDDGLIDDEAAEEILNLVGDVETAVTDGTVGEINRAFRDLRRAIDEFEDDGGIASSDLAASLREAVDDIEAAAFGGR